ncbi:MAG: AAA family ATPase [Actinomycetota bacterium]|nr:AAA family ATPase [Actinomycetota bacterium]MDA2949188.1 AAA family ATPase [Actinomycetota bacterium]
MPAPADPRTKPTPINFPELLTAIGFAPDDLVAISSKRAGIFKGEDVIPVADASTYLFTPDADWYFGINPVRAGLVPPKRGTAADITRVRDLIGDFDIKAAPGFCPSKDVARALIAEIGLQVGAQPVAIVDSGAGLHGHWAVADGDHQDTPALVKLWRSAVETIAASRGIKVDAVFDISRVLRVPGTWNLKYGDPIDVTGYRGPADAKPLTVVRTIKTILAAGITAAPPDPVGPPADAAPEPEQTCDYVKTMTAKWASDTPNAGGHQWLLGQTTRLAAAMRAGCITRADAAAAMSTLQARQVSTTGKEPTDADWRRIRKTANDKAAAMTAEKLASELGDHHAADDLFDTTPPKPKADTKPKDDTSTQDTGIYTARALQQMLFEPLREFVPGLITEGCGLIVGGPKLGKSWWTLALAAALADGATVFGGITTAPTPVLLLALEDGRRRIQDRLTNILGLFGDWPDRLYLIHSIAPDHVAGLLTTFYGEHPGGLAIIDTLGKIRISAPTTGNVYADDYKFVGALKAISDAYPGSGLLIVHHDRKAHSEDFVSGTSGSNGIAGAADYILALSRKRNSDQGVLRVTGRDIVEGEYAMTTTDGVWELVGRNLASAAEAMHADEDDDDRLPDRDRTAIAFVNSRATTTPKDLAEHLGTKDNIAGNILARLAKAERIGKKERGIYTPCTPA